jgi:hypothetical protein
MADFKEQRLLIKFCFELLETAIRNLSGVKRIAFGDETMSRTQTFDCFSNLKIGTTSVDNAERSGRPSTSKMDESVT